MASTSGYKDVVATWTTSGNVGDTLRFRWWQTGQSVSGNYPDIGWMMELLAGGAGYIYAPASAAWSVTIDGETFSGYNTVAIGNNQTKTLASGTKRIYHAADGQKTFGVSFSQAFNISFNSWVGTVSGSSSWTLTTIPRATMPKLNPDAVTMGESISISLPRASSLFTHTLQHDFCAGTWTTFATGAGVSATLDVPVDWAARTPNAAQASGRIRCLTYNGSTFIGEKIVNFKATVPENVVPTMDTITITEAENGIAEKFAAFVQNKSRLRVVSSGTGAQGSTISKYQVEVLGIAYAGEEVVTGFVTSFGAVDVKVTATDSRGRQNSKTVQINVLEYFIPTIANFDAFRANTAGEAANGGTALKCLLDFSIAPCGQKNSKSYVIEYKKEEETAWTTLTSGALYAMDTSYIKPDTLGVEFSYNVRLTVTDYFSSAVYELKVGTEIVPLCVYPNGKGLGIGGYPTKEALQVFFAAEFYKTLKLMNVDGQGTNVDVLDSLNVIGERLTELNNNLVILTKVYPVEAGTTKTDNGKQTWYWRKWSDGSIELWIKHTGWLCHLSDTRTTFKLPFDLPSTNYQIAMSKEKCIGCSVAFFTEAFFIVENKTTSEYTVYCYRGGTNTVTLDLSMHILYKP